MSTVATKQTANVYPDTISRNSCQI